MASRGEASKVELNKASEQELADIDGISADRARVLVEARESQGGFSSWQEVQNVQGFGKALVAKLQAGASLDEASESQQESERMDATEDPEADQVEDDETLEDEIEDEIEALIALAQMDAEAAAGYETAAELIPSPEIQKALLEFAGDHQRHVEDIRNIISGMEIEVEIAAPDPDISLFVNMSSALAAMGEKPALLSLISTEQFTNAAYGTALELVSDPDVRALIERNYADEQRHLRWLSAHVSEPTEHGSPGAAAE